MIADDLRAEIATNAFRRAVEGSGDGRVEYLLAVARVQRLSLARLLEAHLDAVVILREAGHVPETGALYGVWGSRGDVVLDGGVMTGHKPFCSGLHVVDRALVTVTSPASPALLLVEVRAGSSGTQDLDTTGWRTPALAEAATGAVTYRDQPVERVVGAPGFYLDRPGFWRGALRPAACWAGGAAGLLDVAARVVDVDRPHAAAHLGAMHAAVWSARASLLAAARDAAMPGSGAPGTERVARAARHVVERAATSVLDHFGRALGPRPYVQDGDVAQRVADLHLYLRQDHAEQDLEHLGRLAAGVASASPGGVRA